MLVKAVPPAPLQLPLAPAQLPPALGLTVRDRAARATPAQAAPTLALTALAAVQQPQRLASKKAGRTLSFAA